MIILQYLPDQKKQKQKQKTTQYSLKESAKSLQ